MKSRDFCYWLQGFFELSEVDAQLSAHQVTQIRDHLNMVFVHEIDPSFPTHQQAALDAAHASSKHQLPDHMNSEVHYPAGNRPRC